MGTLLSVIVPAYNCAATLDNCLGSVLEQMTEEHELIVVDDGSQDGTARLLAAYTGARPNFRALRIEHAGPSAAKNAGLCLASGEYVTFLDSDDRIRPDFLEKSRPLLTQRADLYIFGIERFYLSGERETWSLRDRVYESVSDFADEYIRTREQLIYSNANKLYRREIVESLGLRFDERISFGEDRLFNYRYLVGCRRIVTSEQLMQQYIQRSLDSLSERHVPQYFDRVMELHRAKTQCFLSLSKGTAEEERKRFASRDIAAEVIMTVRRFRQHPQEEAENLPAVNALVFGTSPDGTLTRLLRERGVGQPEEWYRTQDGVDVVFQWLRELYNT